MSKISVLAFSGWLVVMNIFPMTGPKPFACAGEGDPEKGKALYQESCRQCHGFVGKGDGEIAEFLNPRPANLTSPATQGKSDEELLAVILKGRNGTAMSGYEEVFQADQFTDLLAYLRSLNP